MDVFVANEQPLPVDVAKISTLARHVLESEDVDDTAELSVLFVTEDHIRNLNARFAGQDHATDVLSFPMSEDEESMWLLGDVVVAPQVAQRNARRAGHSVEAELEVLVVHGILHLLGYDHEQEEDEARMKERSREVLETFQRARA